jgi:hypothetical protein
VKAGKEILLLPREKIIFLLSAKCASSAVRRMAINELGYGDDLMYLQPEEIGDYPQFYKVMLARNPYDRIVSLYKDKVLRALYKPFRDLGITKEHTFNEFLKIIANISDNSPRSNAHFWAQTVFYNLVKPNLVIKLEKIDDDWFVLGLPKLGVENASEVKTSYMDFYDEKAIDLVRKRYGTDLELLQYYFGYAYSC